MSTAPQTQGSYLEQLRSAAKDKDARSRLPLAAPLSDPTAPAAPQRNGTAPDAAGMLAQALAAIGAQAGTQALAGAEERLRQLAAESTGNASALAELAEEIEAVRAELAEKQDAAPTPDELRAAFRALAEQETGEVRDLADGKRELLPAIPAACPNYVRTPTGNKIARALTAGYPFILVSGPSGSGKTYPIEQELAALGRRALKLSMADGITRADLIGRQIASAGSTSWIDGVATRAMRLGCALILDEGDKSDPLVLGAINSATERNPSILTPWGETVTPTPGYVVLMTANGITDETGLYRTQGMSADLPNRAYTIHADYLDAAQEKDVLRRTVALLTDGQARTIRAGLEALRAALAKGQIEAAPSTRTGILVAEELTGARGVPPLPLAEAWHAPILGALRPTQRAIALDALRGASAL